MLLGFGVACALVEARRSGQGQVIDAAMVEGASLLAAMFSGSSRRGNWSEQRGVNVLDTGAPLVQRLWTKDGKYISIGSIEERFFQELLSRLDLREKNFPSQHDRARWPEMRALFRKHLQIEDPGRMVQGVRGFRRLLRAGPQLLGIEDASP